MREQFFSNFSTIFSNVEMFKSSLELNEKVSTLKKKFDEYKNNENNDEKQEAIKIFLPSRLFFIISGRFQCVCVTSQQLENNENNRKKFKFK